MALQVVDQNREFDGGLIALSSFGFGGSNMHMVMQGQKRDVPVSKNGLKQITDLNTHSVEQPDSAATAVVTPLAARTAEGLSYLASVIREVRLPREDRKYHSQGCNHHRCDRQCTA